MDIEKLRAEEQLCDRCIEYEQITNAHIPKTSEDIIDTLPGGKQCETSINTYADRKTHTD